MSSDYRITERKRQNHCSQVSIGTQRSRDTLFSSFLVPRHRGTIRSGAGGPYSQSVFAMYTLAIFQFAERLLPFVVRIRDSQSEIRYALCESEIRRAGFAISTTEYSEIRYSLCECKSVCEFFSHTLCEFHSLSEFSEFAPCIAYWSV